MEKRDKREVRPRKIERINTTAAEKTIHIYTRTAPEKHTETVQIKAIRHKLM